MTDFNIFKTKNLNNDDFTSDFKVTFNSEFPLMDGIPGTSARWGITEYHARQLALSGKVKAVRAGGKGKILINQQSMADYFNSSYLTADDPAPTDGLMPIPVKL